MSNSGREFAAASDILRELCEAARLAFPPQDIISSGPGPVHVLVGKAVEIEGKLTSRSHALCLSHNFLTDLPGTSDYQTKLGAYLQSLSSRIENPDENAFMTLSGVPLQVEISWPLRRSPDGRDGLFVRVGTAVRVFGGKEANFALFISGTLQVIAFPTLVPVLTESAVLNAVRKAIDAGQVTFYDSGKHPITLQTASLTTADL